MSDEVRDAGTVTPGRRRGLQAGVAVLVAAGGVGVAALWGDTGRWLDDRAATRELVGHLQGFCGTRLDIADYNPAWSAPGYDGTARLGASVSATCAPGQLPGTDEAMKALTGAGWTVGPLKIASGAQEVWQVEGKRDWFTVTVIGGTAVDTSYTAVEVLAG
jgi:hypothetical protein